MWGLPALFVGTYGTVVIGAAIGVLPLYSLIVLMALPFAIKASIYCIRFHSSPFDMVPANAATIMAHMFTGILLITSFGFTRLETAGIMYVASITAILAALIALALWSGEKREAAMAGVKKAMA